MDTSKAWSVSASLRGFYDDNYLYSAANERDTIGFEVSPSVRFNLPLDQTFLGARYIYSARYYEDRGTDYTGGGVTTDNDPWDHSHQFEFLLNHAFNERYSLDVRDSFVIAQEPEMLAPSGGAIPVPYRTEGDNIRNLGQLSFKAQMTRLLGLSVGYNNVLWDYDNKNGTVATGGPASRSGLLDRIEHLASVDLSWQALPETKASVGYKFGAVQYTSDEFAVLVPGTIGGIPVMVPKTSEIRDNQSHYFYGGVTQNFARNITASASVGATYIDYNEDQYNDDSWIPYANVSGTWSYTTGSYLQLGFLHSFNQTDTIRPDATGKVTSSQETSTIYAMVNHQITSKLVGSASAHYQDSQFQGGFYDSQSDQLLLLGLNLEYSITPHFAVEAGYNFDDLSSDGAHAGYDRNRIYLGVTASF
jgi:hypothetical protein